MIQTLIKANYTIHVNRAEGKATIESPDGFHCYNCIFYYTPEETKKLNNQNKRYNSMYQQKQLYGFDIVPVNKQVVKRMLNFYIYNR